MEAIEIPDTPPYSSVGELLVATRNHQPSVGRGASARAFSFPEGIGLDDYVLRVKHTVSNDELLSSTALSTPRSLLVGINAGQALLQAGSEDDPDRIGIMLKHPGKSLSHRLSAYKPFERREAFYKLLSKPVADGSGNPFEPLLEQAVRFHMAGYRPDLAWNNLFIDEGTHAITLIDQLNGKRRAPEGDAYACLESIRFALIDKLDQYMPADERTGDERVTEGIITLLDEAFAHVVDRCYGLNSVEVLKPVTLLPVVKNGALNPVFSKVGTTQAVSLDAPPHVLLEKLRTLQSVVQEQTR